MRLGDQRRAFLARTDGDDLHTRMPQQQLDQLRGRIARAADDRDLDLGVFHGSTTLYSRGKRGCLPHASPSIDEDLDRLETRPIHHDDGREFSGLVEHGSVAFFETA
jgi:hypothetical protein